MLIQFFCNLIVCFHFQFDLSRFFFHLFLVSFQNVFQSVSIFPIVVSLIPNLSQYHVRIFNPIFSTKYFKGFCLRWGTVEEERQRWAGIAGSGSRIEGSETRELMVQSQLSPIRVERWLGIAGVHVVCSGEGSGARRGRRRGGRRTGQWGNMLKDDELGRHPKKEKEP